MNCADCQQRLEEYALRTPSAREADDVAAHLASGCPECQSAFLEMERACALLAETLQPVVPPENLKTELLTRIKSNDESVDAPAVARSVRLSEQTDVPGDWQHVGTRHLWPSVVACLAASLFGLLAGVWYASPESNRNETVAQLEQRLQELADRFENGTDPSQIRVASLTAVGTQPAVRGHIVLDSVARQLHVYAFDLQPPAEGSMYRLWFITRDERWLSAGELQVKREGVVAAVVDLPEAVEDIVRIIVTEDPVGADPADSLPEDSHGPERLRGSLL